MSNIAFVLGNGESRRGIDINDLMEILTSRILVFGEYRTGFGSCEVSVEGKKCHRF